MTPERIKYFLRSFYESYIQTCYDGYEVNYDSKNEPNEDLERYNIEDYFIKHLDIYIENCNFMKEYEMIYNPLLFNLKKEDNPEVFNDLQIFFIENIQLFLHTILESALNTLVVKEQKVKELKLFMKAIDNKTIKLLAIIDDAEDKMKASNVLPPAMG